MTNSTKYEYTCRRCKTAQVDESGQIRAICHDCVRIGTRRLTDEQYIQWLELQAARIDGGLPLIFWDDETEGAKELYCSWGMCNDDAAAWPRADTWQHPRHTRPTRPAGKKTVEHVRGTPAHWCPFDRAGFPDTTIQEGRADSGCFQRCAIFQAGGVAHLPPQACGVAMFQNTLADFKDYLAGEWDDLSWASRIKETSERLTALMEKEDH